MRSKRKGQDDSEPSAAVADGLAIEAKVVEDNMVGRSDERMHRDFPVLAGAPTRAISPLAGAPTRAISPLAGAPTRGVSLLIEKASSHRAREIG
jgi:hypothetical protein